MEGSSNVEEGVEGVGSEDRGGGEGRGGGQEPGGEGGVEDNGAGPAGVSDPGRGKPRCAKVGRRR